VSKINVHPDHYKVGGRDRQDDAAAARLARAKAAKPTSQERPDRMAKKPWFQRPDSTKPAASGPPSKAAPKKSGPRKASGGVRRPTKRRVTSK
jgi:hypothetical protein